MNLKRIKNWILDPIRRSRGHFDSKGYRHSKSTRRLAHELLYKQELNIQATYCTRLMQRNIDEGESSQALSELIDCWKEEGPEAIGVDELGALAYIILHSEDNELIKKAEVVHACYLSVREIAHLAKVFIHGK